MRLWGYDRRAAPGGRLHSRVAAGRPVVDDLSCPIAERREYVRRGPNERGVEPGREAGLSLPSGLIGDRQAGGKPLRQSPILNTETSP